MILNLITKYQPSLSFSWELIDYKLSSNETPLGTSELIRRQLQINLSDKNINPNDKTLNIHQSKYPSKYIKPLIFL